MSLTISINLGRKPLRLPKRFCRKERGENQQPYSSIVPNDDVTAASTSQEEEKISPRFSLRAIATYQLLSALLVMPHITRAYPQIISSPKNTAILAFFTLLYLMGLVSAIFIFQKKYIGIITGLVFNFFQCIYIQLSAFGYYSTGIFSLIYIFPSRLKVSIGPTFAMSFFETGVWNIGFNMVACVIVLLLFTAETNFREKGQFPEHLY